MKKKAALHNLGCKVNAYETEAMQELMDMRSGGLKKGQMFILSIHVRSPMLQTANPGRCFIKHGK